MRPSALTVAFLGLAAITSGCGGSSAPKVEEASARAELHGPDIWARIEGKVRFQENVPVSKEKAASAVTIQEHPAPHAVGEPGPGDTSPLTFEGAAENLLGQIREAHPLAEGELSYDEIERLQGPALGVLRHAGELVRVLERRRAEARLGEEFARRRGGARAPAPGVEEDEGADLAALEEWAALAERIRENAERFWRGAALHSPGRVRKAWVAVLESAMELPQIRAQLQAMTVEKGSKRGAGTRR